MIDENVGIYIYMNLVDKKKYIGKSTQLKKYFSPKTSVLDQMKYIQSESDLLWEAVKERGLDSFCCLLVENCSEDDLDEREKYWIKKFKSQVSQEGYNKDIE